MAAQFLLLLKPNSAHVLAHTYKLLFSDTFPSSPVLLSCVCVCVFLHGVTPCALDVGHLHALGEAQGALAAFSACFGIRRPERTSIHHGPDIPTSPLFPALPSLPRPHYSSLAPPASCCDNSSYHDIKQRVRGSSPPPPGHPSGPARSPPSHLGLKLALRGATRRKCKANSFSCPTSTSLPPSLCLPPSCCHFLTPSACSCTPPPSLSPRGPT